MPTQSECLAKMLDLSVAGLEHAITNVNVNVWKTLGISCYVNVCKYINYMYCKYIKYMVFHCFSFAKRHDEYL